MSGPVDSVKVQLSVVLGKTTMPINQLLRMGRGAVIELDATEESDVEIHANNTQVALGEVTIQNDKIAVTVHKMLQSMRRRGHAVVTTLPRRGATPEEDGPQPSNPDVVETAPPADETAPVMDVAPQETGEADDDMEQFDIDDHSPPGAAGSGEDDAGSDPNS